DPPECGPMPAPWRTLVREATRRFDGQPARIAELASLAAALDRDGAPGAAMKVIAGLTELITGPRPDRPTIERSLPQLESTVREVFAALGPLRGWTLIGIMNCEIVDVEGATQRIDYVDYTGPSARGSQRRVTVMGFRRMGCFTYLVRWDEQLA